jgi:Zn-dependent protease with chaperone function
MKFLRYLLFAIIFAGCAYESSTHMTNVGVDRKQLLIVSSEQMNQSAAKSYNEVIADAKSRHVLNSDKKELSRVRNIASRLIPQAVHFRSDVSKWNWEVNIIKEDTLNAWCMPGGKIVFYSGIIEKLKLDDDEIAAIMGHEMAHALREHSRERASQQMLTQSGLSIAGSLLGMDELTHELSAQVLNVAITLPNSREHESEADILGLELSARAGYDPNGAIRVWQKMKKISGDSSLEFLSTHPSHDNRIDELKKNVSKVMPLYKQSERR